MNFFFMCPRFYYRSCHGHLPLSPPFWTFRLFFLTLVDGYFLLCQGLLLMPVFSNGVHSVVESVFSPRTRFVDFFLPSPGYFSIPSDWRRVPKI